MTGRFTHIAFNARGEAQRENLKHWFEQVEKSVMELVDGRAQSSALSKLEEAYMWAEKAIQDEQITAKGLD